MFESLRNYIIEKKFSGVVTIRKDNVLQFHESFGMLERANQIPNTVTTSFGIASGTKTFTALGILKLIEEGKLSLETKLFDIIEKPFSSYNKDITVHQLLSHTSGIPDYYDEELIEDFDNFTIETPWHLLEKPSDYHSSMPNREMKFEPGTSFSYSNGGYVFLAMLIEKITGDYHKFVTDKIFKSLELENTGFYKLNQLPSNVANGYIDLEDSWRTNIYNLPIIAGGDGGLFTSSEDLLRVWDALYEGRIVSNDLVSKMLSPQGHDKEDEYYGYGIWLDKKNDHYQPCMVGSDAGVSFISYKTKSNIIVNILSNTSHGVWEISKKLNKML